MTTSDLASRQQQASANGVAHDPGPTAVSAAASHPHNNQTSSTQRPNDPPNGRSRDTKRYLRILTFFGAIILHVIIWDLLLSRVLLLGQWVRRTRSGRFRRWAHRFRLLAIDMGGVMIKLGQFLSVRVDVLPPEVTEELQGLQDEVPAESPRRMLNVLSAELGAKRQQFADIEETPLAAASLGQTHRAWLKPAAGRGHGDAVVVKIQRPDIERIVRTDLDALRIVAQWIMRYRPIRRRANVPALMEEFAETLWEELDYLSEADNAERFGNMYATHDRIYIPRVYRQLSTRRVIVLENVESIKITDVDALRAAGIDPSEVAEVMLTAYFDQIFKEGFFHADPHPGNLFVRPQENVPWPPERENGHEPPTLGRPFWLIFVDFGMVGHVPNLVGDNLRKLLISVTQRDATQLTEAYANMGFFLPGADLERITEAQNTVLDRIYGRNLMELARPDPREVEELGQEFRDLLFDFPFQVPQDFIYLGRAMSMASGLVTVLDDNINPWYYIEKFGRELLVAEDAQAFTWETAVEVFRTYLDTPRRIRRIIEDAEKGRLRVQSVPDRETVRRQEQMEKRVSQLGWSILGAAGMVSATLLYLQRKKEGDS